MATVYVTSDHHFGHANILTFARQDGRLMRPSFSCANDMDKYMIDRWNAVVRPQDHVYHVGDFAMKTPGLGIAKWLNGHKRLVRGNHDIFKTRMYIEAGFTEIYGVRVFEDLVLSHIPLHEGSLKPKWTNVHGHLHNNESDNHWTPRLGPRYFNVSVEVCDYTPLTLEDIRARIALRAAS